ncbi:MAG TPA: 1,4-dihydroxy-6-naphthoate synthase [Chitinophagaceae bacterium]|nr:1,4-dihydroxy-6-naphthoate synthase [Chitinophagaceae bacterium]
MKLTLGFSPCPNDTFIFDALVNSKIDTGDLKFEVILEDVETLNRLALKNTLDISKISYGVLPLLLENYIVLNSGSALGTGVGPLLIANEEVDNESIKNYTIAIPGEHTTAHMLFNLAFPDATNKIFIRYDGIENFVVGAKDKKVAGVIIHENRFTYQQKGLIKIIDLGEFWEQKTQSPIPLGGIVAKRNIPATLSKKIDELIKQSIKYSFANYPVLTEYVRKHSQEMEEDIMRKHIDLYVNDYSIDLGETGKNAVRGMLKVYQKENPGFFSSTEKVFLVN